MTVRVFKNRATPALPIALAALAAIGVLFPESALAGSRLWRANLLDPEGFLPGQFRRLPDTPMVRGPDLHGPISLASEASWHGILRRQGSSESELFAAGMSQTLWARPVPGMVLGLRWAGQADRSRHAEPGRLEARIHLERESQGLAWIQRLPAMGGEAYLEAGVSLPDRRRQAYAWMLAAGRGEGRGEYGLWQEEAEESASVTSLDTSGNGEEVSGVYAARVTVHRAVAKVPLGQGRLSALAAYAESRPRRPDQEFWFCDSSRLLQGRLGYGSPGGPGGWEAWASFQESEAFTLGRRVPPGSEGVKRFHFARNHAVLWEAGAGLGPGSAREGGDLAASGGGRGFRAGALYRSLAWESAAPADAWESRRETLGYNRLGLSFIADLYGGLYKEGELIDGGIRAGLWEAEGAWAGGLGPLRGAVGLSLFRAGFTADARGRTLSQRLVVVDTALAFQTRYRGYLAGATPRLAAGLLMGRLRLELEAAQVLPILFEVRQAGAGGGEDGERDAARYPLFRNGFSARAGLAAGI